MKVGDIGYEFNKDVLVGGGLYSQVYKGND